MKKTILALSALLLFQAAWADNIEAKNAYAFATFGQSQGGAFVQLNNTTSQDDVLIQAKANQSIAQKTELHTHVMENGVMKMRAVKGITIKAKQQHALKPGGDHIMFLGLKKDLVNGQTFPVELTFKSGEKQTIMVKVVEAAHQHQHMHHHH